MRSAAAPRHAGCLRGTRAGGQGREAGEQSRGKEGCGQRGRCRRMELRCRVPRGGGRRGDPAARSRRWGERGAPTDPLACDTTPTPCSDSAARAAARSRSGVLTLWRWQLKAAKRGTATFPDAGDVWEARGTVEEAAGLLDAAAASFSRALELDPGRAVAALKARTSPSPPPPPPRLPESEPVSSVRRGADDQDPLRARRLGVRAQARAAAAVGDAHGLRREHRRRRREPLGLFHLCQLRLLPEQGTRPAPRTHTHTRTHTHARTRAHIHSWR